MTNVVISLVTYNGEKYLQPCLESVLRQTYRDGALVILDNASSDNTRDSIAKFAPAARIIASEKNIGFARGHNEVIRQTQSEYVLVLNQDLVLEPDYLERCVNFLEQNPRVGSVTGLLLRVPSLTADAPRDIIDTYGIVLSKTMRAKDAGAGLPLALLSRRQKIMGVSGTAALYRRSALEDVAIDLPSIILATNAVECSSRRSRGSEKGVYGNTSLRTGAKNEEMCQPRSSYQEYFDEDFFMYKEDVDLALRLQMRGWGAAAVPDARGYHVRTTDPALLKRPSALVNQWSYRNGIYILIKDVAVSHWLKYGVFICIYEGTKFLYLCIFERATLGALADVWRNRKKMLAKRSYIMKRAKQDIA
ncbi:MAG: glycosyltransferase family 2 protein [Candidatus Uhrbacteria bacterium]|nr:glycosyltransferase family 2 protein [Candidatus Uhrbacteria bacterium]